MVAGEPVALSDRQADALLILVEHAGHIVSKDDLTLAGWKDVAVGDNSLEQVISSLRRQLAAQWGPRRVHRDRGTARLSVRGRRDARRATRER
jgi:DNA-binding winged helix-turn-helix (wHTH) protein